MTTMPAKYFNRFDATKQYEKHLFIAGRGLQSAELNEIQDQLAYRMKSVSDGIFLDGGVVSGAAIAVNPTTGVVNCGSGAVYVAGVVRGLIPATITVPVTGAVSIGVRLTESVISVTEDAALKDPASGTRNYNNPGAGRLKVEAVWSWSGATGGNFYPVYGITNGVLDAKAPPPELNTVTQSLARYDRDSAGGNYVVTGLNVTMLPDISGVQQYSIAEGKAQIYGYAREFQTSRRVTLTATPDTRQIINEPFTSATAIAQRVDFDQVPGFDITTVTITKQTTVTMVHGVAVGAQDPIPDTSVISIVSVTQGATTFVAGTDYNLTGGNVDWSPGGAEPAGASSYNVTYQSITPVTPTAVDDTGFTVTGALPGTLVLTTYRQKLPRIDRLCLNQAGTPIWITGVAAVSNPLPPEIPADVLAIASIYQTWTASRSVVNDGVRVVPMEKLATVDKRIDLLAQLIAQNRLESAVHLRESGAKKGIFADPFIDDSLRDAGTAQTGAIVLGELVLPVLVTIKSMGADITKPTVMNYTQGVALEQPYKTGSMKINPYLAFDVLPGQMTLTPAVDRWTISNTVWASDSTKIIETGWGNRSFLASETTRTAVLGVVSTEIKTLRPTVVAYSISGFGSGEILSSLTFDGVSLPVGPVANGAGIVSGSFTVPANIPAGVKLVEAIGAGGTKAKTTYIGQGTLEVTTLQRQTTRTIQYYQADPLAQTFTMEATTQCSGVDLWFAAIPTGKCTVQIRTTANGFPSQTIMAEKLLQPTGISAVGTATRVALDFPVTLIGGSEYAVVVLCDDAVGALSIAELGQFDSTAQKWMTSQPYTVGLLLSSSNAVTWTPHQASDLAFRILKPAYTTTTRTVALGSVSVVGATDLMLSSFAEFPSSLTKVSYRLTLPSGNVIVTDDGLPIQLTSPVTGLIQVDAVLTGTADFSPVLYPGAQLFYGVLGSTGTYVSTFMTAGVAVTAKVIYEAIVPSGASIDVQWKGPLVTDVWSAPIAIASTSAASSGFSEFVHTATPITATQIQVRLTLNGAIAARPRVRDLRVVVM